MQITKPYNTSNLKIRATEYECNICNDRGFVPNDNGSFVGLCKCQEIRKARHNLKKSNLADVIKKYTFENFETDTDFLKDYKKRAMSFVQNTEGWFAMLGQTGLGKSHLMTAMTIHLIGKGKQAYYVKWQNEMIKSKNNFWNIDQKLLDKLKTVEVLYIDDFLKTDDGEKVHAEENRLAFNIIDSRYLNPKLITIISSEKNIKDINQINGALAGRIVEMCGGLESKRLIDSGYKENGNYRFR